MRLLYLIKKEFIESKRSLIVYAITIISIVGGLAILRTTFNQYTSGGSEELYGGLFSGFLFLG
ncbi:MAG: hypothetical protein EOM67_08680, partial [Spirochaetia bacterium]|nr:hypothetical protein [Spirochaetia bacterium]